MTVRIAFQPSGQHDAAKISERVRALGGDAQLALRGDREPLLFRSTLIVNAESQILAARTLRDRFADIKEIHLRRSNPAGPPEGVLPRLLALWL